MPQIPTITAGGDANPPYNIYPRSFAVDVPNATGEAAFHELGRMGRIIQRIAAQHDERQAADAIGEWKVREAEIRASMFQADPLDPSATVPDLADVETTYKKKVTDLQSEIGGKLGTGLFGPGGARLMFNDYITRDLPAKLVDVRIGTLKRAASEERAAIEESGDTTARAASIAETPEEREELMGRYLGRLANGQQRGILNAGESQALADRFIQKVLAENASILSRTPEGRERLYQLNEAGDYARLDPDRLSRILQSAYAADVRAEGAGRANEHRVSAAREDRKIEIGTLISQGNLTEAQARLEFYGDLRLLGAAEIEHLRNEITSPKAAPSNPAVAGRILLDVESINPTVSEAEIDDLFARYQRGEPGLSLADAVKAKNQLRSTSVALANRTSDQALAASLREHNQAEQELRAQLGIKPGIVSSVMQDSPENRLYSALLPELRKRSRAFGGDEAPLAVVESMRERILKSLGAPAALKPNEIQGLFPDWQSLERARAENKITQESYEQEIRRRQGLSPVPLAPVAPPPPAKRRSLSFPQ